MNVAGVEPIHYIRYMARVYFISVLVSCFPSCVACVLSCTKETSLVCRLRRIHMMRKYNKTTIASVEREYRRRLVKDRHLKLLGILNQHR